MRPVLRLVPVLVALALATAAEGCGDGASPVGTLHVAVTTDPAAPMIGRNTFHVEVTSAAGEPLDAAVTVTPWMPAHGHGSTESPTVTAAGKGRFTAFPVTLFMAGDWQVTARAEQGGEFGELVLRYSLQ